MAQSFTWPLAAPATVATPAAAPPSIPAPLPVDYGTDFDTSTDLTFTPVSGYQAIGQAVIRSLSDALDGIDLRQELNEALDAAGVYDLRQAVQRQCLADERVRSAAVSVDQPDRLSLSITITLVPSNGSPPFTLVLAVSQLSVSLLSMSLAQ